MGLIRGMARTAVVAGTATAVSNRVSRRQARRWSAEPEPAEQYDAQPATDPLTEQLQQLDGLRRQGIITQAEFEAKKAQVLGI
jgi:hypothetical protein